MKKLVIELEFDQVEEDGYNDLVFERMNILDNSTVTEVERAELAERWAQSDWYWVGFCNSFIALLDSAEVDADHVKNSY